MDLITMVLFTSFWIYPIVAMLDARRMEVFALVLNSKKEILKPTFAEIQ